MATVGGATVFTMADYKKSLDPDGQVAKVVEILNETNDMIPDILWKEGNLDTGHLHTIRSGIPAPTWRRLNYGVQQSKARKVQVTDACGMLEAVSAVDERLLTLGGNKADIRFDEDAAHIEGMAQELSESFIYANQASAPEEITGFSPRYADTATSDSSTNVIDAGGTGTDNTSIWLVGWGSGKVFGIFPKGTSMGLRMLDQGRVEESDSQTPAGTYMAWKTRYYWDVGLALADWRYAVRICNIDNSLLIADKGTVSSGANLIVDMILAMHKIPNLSACKPVFYANETVLAYLDLQTLKQSNMNITYANDPHGKRVVSFRGIPVRKVDSLGIAEARIV
ncbi:hypothetical protein KAR91_23810 [Candidatus Pacearchaeota archaeon]|nr:hypothetical protein [Candidatus Pacearchaeota archaeon]